MAWIFKDKFRTAVLALIIANTVWGAGPPIYKWALSDIGPFSLAFFRFFGATLLILPFAYKNLKIHKEDFKKFFLMSFLGITLNISFFFIGLKYAPSINAGIISCASPIFILLSSFIFLRERPRKKVIIGAHIGLLGVLVVVLSPLLKSGISTSSGIPVFGNLMLVIAMLTSIGTYIFGRELMEKYNPITVTFWNFAIGSITFFPLFFNEAAFTGFNFHFSIKALIAIMYGIIFSSAIAYFLVNWSLKYMRASDTGIFIYIDPVATVLIAVPLLAEVPGPLYLIGSIMVFAGIYIAEGRLHWHPLHLLRK